MRGRDRPFQNDGPYGRFAHYRKGREELCYYKILHAAGTLQSGDQRRKMFRITFFEQQGFLKISGEHQVDYKDVFNWFIELVKVYKIKPLKVGYDRYCAGYLVQEMKEAGFHMDDVYQGTNPYAGTTYL